MSKLNYLFLLLLILATNITQAQNIEYELLGDQIIHGNMPGEVHICNGALHNYTSDTIQIQLKRVEFEVDDPSIFTSICTEHLCYTVGTNQIIESIPPGTDYKLEMRWAADVSFQGLNEGMGKTRWEILDLSNSIFVDTIQSEFHYSILSSNSNIEHNEIFVYPNPANDNLYFRDAPNDFDVQVFNANGELIISENNSDTFIDINNLDCGFYFGILTSNHIKKSFKFVKQ